MGSQSQVDFTNEDEVKDYLQNLGTEYSFHCYSEKRPEACERLGNYFEQVKQDWKSAGKVYKYACDVYKEPKSCFKTGFYYLLAKGEFPEDIEQSLHYMKLSCERNNADGCNGVGYLYELQSQNKLSKQQPNVQTLPPESIEHYQRGCDLGNKLSCEKLFRHHFNKNTDADHTSCLSMADNLCKNHQMKIMCDFLRDVYTGKKKIGTTILDPKKAEQYSTLSRRIHRQEIGQGGSFSA